MLAAQANLQNRSPGAHPKQRWRPKEIVLVIPILLMAVAAAGCTGAPAARTATATPAIASTVAPVVPSSTAVPPRLATASAVPTGSRPPGSLVKGYRLSGYVTGGGDTTPADLLDAPRKFSYTLQTDDGLSVTVTYTAYPPSPNPAVRKIRLSFHAGGILIGDYVQARGSYDQDNKTLLVADEGDYIETFARKP